MNPNFSNFTASESPTGRKTVFWFRVYCAALAILYVLVAGLGVFLAIANPSNSRYDAQETFIVGVVYLILGAILFLVFAVGIFMPVSRWSWIYGMILICLGMTSCCLLPATIPLLIYWLKPETKALFGR